jgi:membrane dipeptidase
MADDPFSAPGVYRDNLVVDGLVVAPPSGKFVQELVDARITACNWTVVSHREDTATALSKITQFYWLLEQFPECTLLVEKGSDIERAKMEKKLGIILGFQGTGPLGYNVNLLRIFHRLGVRVIQLAYNESSPFATGCLEPSNSGLTSLGIQLVQEMNRLGVVIDLSHVGHRASMETIELSQDPVIFSHSNPSALQQNPRNIPDDLIRACAAKGGVIGLSTFSAFVGETRGGRHPALEEYLHQMDHVLGLVGSDHVAIGADILVDATDGVWWRAVTGRLYPDISQGMTYETHNVSGYMHPTDMPTVANAMLSHGYADETVRKIIGANWRRVFGRVWDRQLNPIKEA